MYIVRRLLRIASEDVGMADPQALVVASAAQEAVHFLGIPEGDLALAQTVRLPGHGAEEQRALHSVHARPRRMLTSSARTLCRCTCATPSPRS